MTGLLFIALAAIGFYLAATVLIGQKLFSATPLDNASKKLTLLLGLVAVLLHAYVIYQGMAADQGINLNFAHASSLVTWLIAVLLIVTTLHSQLETLIVLFFPLAAIALGAEFVFDEQPLIARDDALGLQLHILFSIVSYSLLSIAAFQAVVLAYADSKLHSRRPTPVLQVLPPLQTMESLLFQIILLGVVLLTVALLTGIPYIDDIMGQHLVHKTILSLLAWIIFVILLWGRHRFGWRGRTAIRFTLGGMFTLLMAYFGSKAVLELILQRV